jgi:hypothetical protein
MNAPLLADGRYLLVVRRGDASLLFGLGHCLECAENVDVIQDRRVGERRSGKSEVDQEHRAVDRRQTTMGPALALLAQRDGR